MIKLVTTKPNGIHLREFAIITHLAHLWAQGFPVPSTLPSSLAQTPVFRYVSDEYDDASFSVPPPASLYQDYATGEFIAKYKVTPTQRMDGLEGKDLRRGEVTVATFSELSALREPSGVYFPAKSFTRNDGNGSYSMNSTNSMNSMNSLILQSFQRLRRVIISNHVGSQITTFKLSDLPQLESLHIGEDCFTLSERSDVGNPYSQRDRVMRVRASFVVEHCPLLTEMMIGNNSFSDYPLFRVEDCRLLQSVRVGTADVKDTYNNRSYGFYSCSDLELIGM